MVAVTKPSSHLLFSSSQSLSRLSPFQLCVFDTKTLVSFPSNNSSKKKHGAGAVKCMAVGTASEAEIKKKNTFGIQTLTESQHFQFNGVQGAVNVQGEDQKKLDVVSNEVFSNCLRSSGRTGIIASEEEDVPVAVEESYSGNYIVVFDPLDGSSNIDAAVSTGSILAYIAQMMSA
ncbi:hypothetical protein GH714_009027 [Hevea brasiliensis]|uniref:Fructose-1-6-bisphosphatase class I N-terminal domain-containing protein n=1 Tax=Hevea brasiliensis TaxID=3981 RepID=A0A6A6KIL7_HEVBR|nr:hypothetical protein GH714_009027 [Hevea brasiliensis]